MRKVLLVVPFLAILSGCGASPLYSQQDFHQVMQSYSELRPLYIDFRAAFERRSSAEMSRDYAAEQGDCKLVDRVDQRDTIDPNTNLFLVSALLDNFCNDIESVYAAWQKAHHRPYDKTVIPAVLSEAFIGSDKEIQQITKAVRHPSDLS